MTPKQKKPKLVAKRKKPGESGKLTYQSGGKNVAVVADETRFAVGVADPAAEGALEKALRGEGRVEFSPKHGVALIECAPGVDPRGVEERVGQLVEAGHLEFCAPLLHDATTGHVQILNDEITVRFNPKLTLAAVRKLAARHGLAISRQNEFVANQFVLKLPRSRGLAALKAASTLDREAMVEFATPNFLSGFRKLM